MCLRHPLCKAPAFECLFSSSDGDHTVTHSIAVGAYQCGSGHPVELMLVKVLLRVFQGRPAMALLTLQMSPVSLFEGISFEGLPMLEPTQRGYDCLVPKIESRWRFLLPKFAR